MSTIYLMRANNESVIKSERAKKGYEKRLNESITNKKSLLAKCHDGCLIVMVSTQ